VTRVGVAIYVNGAVVAQTLYPTGGGAAGSTTIAVKVPVTDLVYLNPGDTVKLYAYHNQSGGSAKNLLAGSSITFMSISREITG